MESDSKLILPCRLHLNTKAGRGIFMLSKKYTKELKKVSRNLARYYPHCRTSKPVETTSTKQSFKPFLPKGDIACEGGVISLSSPVCCETAYTGGKASSLAFMTQNLEDICVKHPGKDDIGFLNHIINS